MSIKRILGVLSLILLSAPVLPGLLATLASPGTQCTFEYDLVASPGLLTTPSSGTITTNGETGTFDCNGPVNGQQPTGGGTSGAPFSAKFEGDRMSGTMGVTPIDGDCASKQTTCRCAGWWIIWRCAVT